MKCNTLKCVLYVWQSEYGGVVKVENETFVDVISPFNLMKENGSRGKWLPQILKQ